MDSRLRDGNILNWSPIQIEHLICFVEAMSKYKPKEIAVVGSRIQGRYRENSDIDIVVFTDKINRVNRKDNLVLRYLGFRVGLSHWPYSEINSDFKGYDLPKYLLYSKKFIDGKDVDKWDNYRKKFKMKGQKNGKNTTRKNKHSQRSTYCKKQ